MTKKTEERRISLPDLDISYHVCAKLPEISTLPPANTILLRSIPTTTLSIPKNRLAILSTIYGILYMALQTMVASLKLHTRHGQCFFAPYYTHTMQQRKKELHLFGILLTLAFLAVGCSQTATQTQAQQTAIVNPSFQNSLTPLPTVPPYRCGAWASNNAPNIYSTITIFARLTKNIAGVEGATAHSVVHFTNDGDVALDTQPLSDNGGYVSFTLPLNGRQPSKIPATVSVSFTITGVKQTINCSLAFFTPH